MMSDWRTRARCAEVDTDLFFPGPGGSNITAKRICARCEVRTACYTFAIRHPEIEGIWGGTSTRERSAIRAQLDEIKKGTAA
jgi:WhiB family redox-sensing transcriptional regulator